MSNPLSGLFISNAYAQSAGSAQQGGGLSFFFIFAILILFMYFAIWRPQSKRAKEQQALLAGLVNGDEVLTAGGLLGRVIKISDQYIVLSVANNVEIVMQKSSIVNVMPKGTLKSIS